jgi:hypothetical protein
MNPPSQRPVIRALRLAAFAALPLAAQPSPADGPWSGSVRCEIDVSTGSYSRREPHIWPLTAAALNQALQALLQILRDASESIVPSPPQSPGH